MVGEKKLKEIAERALALSPSGETEVLLWVSENGLTRFANTRIHQNVAWEDVSISVRVALGKKIGVAGGNRFDDTGLKQVVDTAVAIAKLQKEDPYFQSLPTPHKLPTITADYRLDTVDERSKKVSVILEKAKAEKIVASGSFQSGLSELAIANSHGVWAYHISSSADLSTILLGENSTGFAGQVGSSAKDIDAESVANTAIQKVVLGKNPRDVAPGEWDVILEPQAVNELITFFAFMGPNARIYHEQASFLSGKLGTKVADEKVSIVDDPLHPDAFPMPFDFEGYPKQKTSIIENGILKSLVYDSYYATRFNATNTGHALPAPNTGGPIPLHLTILPGNTSRESMIKNVKRGLLVTRLWYIRVLNPRSLSLTGMTRDGLFLIENGEIVGGVKNMRFNQSISEMLQNVEAIEDTLTPLSSFESEIGINRMPSLHIKNWTFSSGTLF
jgi:predicted Zn-dependent protease